MVLMCCACDERVHVILFSGKPYCTQCFKNCGELSEEQDAGTLAERPRESRVAEEDGEDG